MRSTILRSIVLIQPNKVVQRTKVALPNVRIVALPTLYKLAITFFKMRWLITSDISTVDNYLLQVQKGCQCLEIL